MAQTPLARALRRTSALHTDEPFVTPAAGCNTTHGNENV